VCGCSGGTSKHLAPGLQVSQHPGRCAVVLKLMLSAWQSHLLYHWHPVSGIAVVQAAVATTLPGLTLGDLPGPVVSGFKGGAVNAAVVPAGAAGAQPRVHLQGRKKGQDARGAFEVKVTASNGQQTGCVMYVSEVWKAAGAGGLQDGSVACVARPWQTCPGLD